MTRSRSSSSDKKHIHPIDQLNKLKTLFSEQQSVDFAGMEQLLLQNGVTLLAKDSKGNRSPVFQEFINLYNQYLNKIASEMSYISRYHLARFNEDDYRSIGIENPTIAIENYLKNIRGITQYVQFDIARQFNKPSYKELIFLVTQRWLLIAIKLFWEREFASSNAILDALYSLRLNTYFASLFPTPNFSHSPSNKAQQKHVIVRHMVEILRPNPVKDEISPLLPYLILDFATPTLKMFDSVLYIKNILNSSTNCAALFTGTANLSPSRELNFLNLDRLTEMNHYFHQHQDQLSDNIIDGSTAKNLQALIDSFKLNLWGWGSNQSNPDLQSLASSVLNLKRDHDPIFHLVGFQNTLDELRQAQSSAPTDNLNNLLENLKKANSSHAAKQQFIFFFCQDEVAQKNKQQTSNPLTPKQSQDIIQHLSEMDNITIWIKSRAKLRSNQPGEPMPGDLLSTEPASHKPLFTTSLDLSRLQRRSDSYVNFSTLYTTSPAQPMSSASSGTTSFNPSPRLLGPIDSPDAKSGTSSLRSSGGSKPPSPKFPSQRRGSTSFVSSKLTNTPTPLTPSSQASSSEVSPSNSNLPSPSSANTRSTTRTTFANTATTISRSLTPTPHNPRKSHSPYKRSLTPTIQYPIVTAPSGSKASNASPRDNSKPSISPNTK